MSESSNPWPKLLLLGLPLLLLFVAGIGITGYLSIQLVRRGFSSGSVSEIIVGSLIGLLWLFMLKKTYQGVLQERSKAEHPS